MSGSRGAWIVRGAPGWLPLHAGFALTGAATVLLGPLLPELSREWRLPASEIGSLFVVQFLSSSVGALLSSCRLGLSLLFGYLLVAAGLALLALADWPLALVPMAVVGLGLGLAIPATNLVVAHARPTRRGAALSTLNLIWGVGAVACPLLFALRPPGMSGDDVLMFLAAAAGLVLLTLTWPRRPTFGGDAAAAAVSTADESDDSVDSFASGAPTDPTAPRRAALADDRPRPGGALAPTGAPALRRAGLVLIAAILFLYVGVENSVGGWLVSLADEFQPARSAASLWIGSGFWAALLASRAVAPLLLRRMSEPALYAAGLVLAASGLLGLLTSSSRSGAAVSAMAVGAGLAPLFPLTLSFLADLTAATRSRNTGWIFALAGAGGAVLPWLTGRLADGADGLAGGFVAPVAGLAALALLFVLLRRMARAGPPPRALNRGGAGP